MADKRLARLDTFHAKHVLGELYRKVERLPNGIERVVVHSLNRAIYAMRTETSKAIREEYAAPKKDVDATMWVRHARPGTKIAVLYARGRMSIPLIRWGAKPTKKGVTVKIRQGAGRKLISTTGGKKDRPLLGAFIAKGEVYGRTQKASYPIVRLYGPSFLSVLGRPETRFRQQVRAEEIFSKRVLVEANRILDKVKA
ncbi:hypothetical protein [Nitratidesulfovibrio vulgaris]|uniref:Uncharacterized protein n=1 Tax=Nitratidesulfovibrio vulgaris (strain ATCC 29579 / DSM 644 / CCUG 34227 / NCIMB 8303 / VKM B-1760 / Hildenborough) TaxID=882 RepID=Q727J2_NITV2|nr:hypothetical protein [Nitratidesulfovibrio vulgaris]AAS94690.1 hypothetical protein DVU_0206 [Nitratidesulfovibrio vulgaris str. Hildenborough]AAS97335.1 hypothetical protein DVU_2863 [Nitratidesulfovibrio vulgaris str. Hildenborough]ADP87786.1 hypothetical protein Deval_2644 [Nitratidesulfovibrio vulgaris RCH1]